MTLSPDIMTLGEVAGYLRVTEKTIYRLLWRNRIPATKVGKQWRFDRAAVDAWIRRNSVSTSASILVIDEDEEVQVLFRSIFRNLGDNLKSVTDGSAGLELLRRYDFDIVFLDLTIQSPDGVEVLRQIKDIRPQQTVVILTGGHDSAVMEQALAYGPYFVVAKPFDEVDILAAARNFVRCRA